MSSRGENGKLGQKVSQNAGGWGPGGPNVRKEQAHNSGRCKSCLYALSSYFPGKVGALGYVYYISQGPGNILDVLHRENLVQETGLQETTELRSLKWESVKSLRLRAESCNHCLKLRGRKDPGSPSRSWGNSSPRGNTGPLEEPASATDNA